MTSEAPTPHEHHWLDDLRQYRWCMECLYKEIRLDIGCEIWVPLLYGDALIDLQVDFQVAEQRVLVLTEALERWRFLFAEHDIDEVHPLHIVNVIAQTDAALEQGASQ